MASNALAAGGASKPESALGTHLPQHRGHIEAQMRAVQDWNASCVRAEFSPRLAPKSWSDEARLPWMRGRSLDFGGGACELVGPAANSRDILINQHALSRVPGVPRSSNPSTVPKRLTVYDIDCRSRTRAAAASFTHPSVSISRSIDGKTDRVPTGAEMFGAPS